MKTVSATLLMLAAAVAVLMVAGQAPFSASKFEWGGYREYAGRLETWPYPMLVTADARYLLVGPGKHGVGEVPAGQVRLKGELIARGADKMIEILPGSIHVDAASTAPTQPVDLGPVRLNGEIVDSKCYLGVMNPGAGKVHRDCAARCISGGAPAAFVARDASGETRVLLLTGVANPERFVAERVEISGDLQRVGSTLVLKSTGIKRASNAL